VVDLGLRISFNLDEEDLQHFRLIMRQSSSTTANAWPEDIVADAEKLLAKIETARIPGFVRERLASLELMIQMLKDHEWRLPEKESSRVLNALAYFGEPEDLIPDHIPGLGFLDDAIMIELVVRELRHEIEAYRDFCDYRDRMQPRSGVKMKTTDVTRDDWLAGRRKELQARIRRRRKNKGEKKSRKSSFGLF
jgi:uncharacterized membrane protein YkvA (DUF1232 family)